jgi:glucose/arabinose dehydrogenase
MPLWRSLVPLLLATLALGGCATDVPDAPAGDAGFRLQEVAGSFRQPVLVTHADDGSARLFIVEQGGLIKVREQGTWSTYLDLTGRVTDGGERGLLGLAFHPGYEVNGRLFVHYSGAGGDTVVSEFRGGGVVGDVRSERILLQVEQPYPNHNGGMLAFGPDGMLYLGLGDGGSANDPQNRAQNLDSLLGKILRIDVDASTILAPYGIPGDNPFADRGQGREIWAYGLRNPWRFSFDRQTGDLWIGDVGQGQYEEIDRQPADSQGGENYGWSRFEGRHVHDADREAPGAVAPVAEYDHDGGHCSISGGYVYRGSAMPGLQGTYIVGDYCTGVVWTLDADGSAGYALTQVMDTPHRISSFGEDEDGELYLVDHGGKVFKLVAD